MAASSQQYCLRWNNHQSNLLSVFDELLQNEAFTDVTLAVDGGSIKCHKMVLVASSSYFQSLFMDLPCRHPIVVLKDVKFWEIKAILEYMYRGEVNVAQDQLGDLIKIAEVLNVKGLVKENSGESRESINRREDSEMSSPPHSAISTSTGNAAHSSGHASPPHSTGGCYADIYGNDVPIERGSQNRYVGSSMWQLSGLPLHHPVSSHQSSSPHHPAVFGSTSYDKCLESSFKRKKLPHQQSNLFANRDTPILRTVLGQGHADSSQTGIPVPRTESHEELFRSGSKGSAIDIDRRNSSDLSLGETAHSPYKDVVMNEEEKQQSSPQSYSGDSKSDIVNYTSVTKPEWKRYKQYTKDDITRAIDAVKTGMSAVQAARKFGVPSRTLYDKVKKLGITTSRPFKRASNGNSTACFPYGVGSNVNGSIYSGVLPENDGENTTKSVTSVTPESVYAKAKDTSHDRSSDSAVSEAMQCSPVIRCTKQEQNIDDEVEDLSVSRKSDVPVIVPTTSGVIKEEVQDIRPDCN